MTQFTVTLKGNRQLERKFGRLRKNTDKFSTEYQRKLAKFAKNSLQKRIRQTGANASGQLLQSVRRRTTKRRSIVRVDAPHAGFVNRGVRPHWVHRSMVSPAGYSVGDWMDGKGITGNFILVGGSNSKIKKPGTQFFEKSMVDIRRHARRLVKEYNEVIRK